MAATVKLMLPPALGSYVNIFKPRAANEGDEPKYGLSLLWLKEEADGKDPKKSLAALRKAIVDVATTKWGPTAEKLLKAGKLHNPLRDGDADREEDEVYAGKYFLNANSKRQPGIVDSKLNVVFEEAEAYSGCTFRASVALFPFEVNGKKGVGVGLNNLQVVKKGERIDGRKDAADEFAEFAEDGEGEAGDEGGKPAKKGSPAKGDEDLSDIE